MVEGHQPIFGHVPVPESAQEVQFLRGLFNNVVGVNILGQVTFQVHSQEQKI